MTNVSGKLQSCLQAKQEKQTFCRRWRNRPLFKEFLSSEMKIQSREGHI